MEERNYYFDNLKGLLIILVVIGHIVEPVAGCWQGRIVYVFIYSFHIPLFCFISGYFSSSDLSFESISKSSLNLLVPFIIFQLLTDFSQGYIPLYTGNETSLLEPNNPLWYVFCLFFWRLILPLAVMIPGYCLFFAVLALLIGYIESIGSYLCLSRLIAFFPFFVFGYWCKERKNIKFKHILSPKTATLIILGAGCLSIYFRWVSLGWFWCSSYAHIGQAEWYAAVYRFFVFATALIVGLSVITLVPKKKMFITKIGIRSIYAYLLHMFLINYLYMKGFYNYLTDSYYLTFLLIPFGVLLSYLFCTDPIYKTVKPFVQPSLFFRHFLTKTKTI